MDFNHYILVIDVHRIIAFQTKHFLVFFFFGFSNAQQILNVFDKLIGIKTYGSIIVNSISNGFKRNHEKR